RLGASRRARAEAAGQDIGGVGEACPFRLAAAAIAGKGTGLAFPPGINALRPLDLRRLHAVEIIIAGVEGADMVEAQPAPTLPGRRRASRRRTELALLGAPFLRTERRARWLRPAMETATRPGLLVTHGKNQSSHGGG